MWEKRATSAECKTIRIAESSDMDSWNELLDPMCKFYKILSLGKKIESASVLRNYTGKGGIRLLEGDWP